VDRTLVAEFPWLIVESTASGGGFQFQQVYPTDSTIMSGSYQRYKQEMKIDLSGYVQSDLTVGFRRSFEQKGGIEYVEWDTYDPNSDYVLETVLVSSVPLNDDQLIAATSFSPGFTNPPVTGLDLGNFNRNHIIHGSYKVYYANSIVGAGAFSTAGAGTLVPVHENYFSSLEPTAADCLYCYRVFFLPPEGTIFPAANGVTNISMPALRVILDSFTVEEPDLEYMMRLKRSYELANQV